MWRLKHATKQCQLKKNQRGLQKKTWSNENTTFKDYET